jgi:Proteins of 100 residues with WXG
VDIPLGRCRAPDDAPSRRKFLAVAIFCRSGWSGQAQATSLDAMGRMNQAFRNIVTMLHGVRDGLVRDANNCAQQEQASQQVLSS